MKYNDQRAFRSGEWKYLKVNEHEYLFNLAQDERERANLARRHPDRLKTMRDQFMAWSQQLPAIPEQAQYHLVYGLQDMPAR